MCVPACMWVRERERKRERERERMCAYEFICMWGGGDRGTWEKLFTQGSTEILSTL